MLIWIRLTALLAAVEAQASPVKPASGWSAIRAWPWSRRVGSSSDASGLLFPTAVAPHVMRTTGCAVRNTGGLLGEGQTLEGDFEQTSLTTESRWGHQFTCRIDPSKKSRERCLALNSEMNRGFLPGPLGVIAPAAAQRA